MFSSSGSGGFPVLSVLKNTPLLGSRTLKFNEILRIVLGLELRQSGVVGTRAWVSVELLVLYFSSIAFSKARRVRRVKVVSVRHV